MKELYAKYKNYILIGGLVIAASFAYFTYFGGGPEPILVSNGQVQNNVGQDLLKQLLQLRALQLNDAIFSRPAFESLQDFSQELVAEPVGRVNPFSPLGVDPAVPAETASE